jgi:hypothetical protein
MFRVFFLIKKKKKNPDFYQICKLRPIKMVEEFNFFF